MIKDIKFEHSDTFFDIETHPTGVFIEIYNKENYTSFPLTIKDIRKIRDHFSNIINDLESVSEVI